MSKALIITEKPSVAREFANVLGVSGRNDGYIENDKYVITWCVGHLVSMCYPESYDEKYKQWRLEDLPFLPQDYKYDVIPNVQKQYDIVHKMLFREDIDKVYWAGDAGKEGQTIEENIRNFGGVREGMEELRVWIDSQTEEEIRRGLNEAKPMSDYANLGKSGIMRTIEDYAMGINFSRVMSVQYGNLLNEAAGTKSYTAIAVGRVMTCVLGMVVIREREIRNFKETPFYRIVGNFFEEEIEGEWKVTEDSRHFESPLLYKENGFKEEQDALNFMESLEGKTAYVSSVEKSVQKKRAPLLFNLAELQAECSKRFKISPDETLQVVQDLYEKKLTTYPRTDARVLSSAVAKEISKNVSRLKGYEPTAAFVEDIMKRRSYIGIGNSPYTDDSKVTDHYAIIPTGQLTELNSLNSLQRSVFDLIVRRFLSIFYPPAEYNVVKINIAVDNEHFFASGKILMKKGFLEIAGRIDKEENAEETSDSNAETKEQAEKKLLALVDQIKQGDEVSVKGFTIKEGKTSPPKRYTSGSMVLAMENAGQLIEDEELRAQIKGSGIGTSATRAEIIKKLVRIGYLNLNRKSQVLTPENLGEMVFEVVSLTVPDLLNPRMSASWEKGLDGITKGEVDFWEYRKKLEDYIRKETLSMISNNLRNEIAGRIHPLTGKESRGIRAKIKLGVKCPSCGGEMETTPFGYGCSNYQKDGSGCKFSIGQIAGRNLSMEEAKELLETGKTAVLDGFVSKNKKKFSAKLLLVKDENGVPAISFDFSEIQPEILTDVVCPQCGGEMLITGFGYRCAKYNKEDENSCHFSIGQIAGKSLSASVVKELLTEKKTQTIRGFKSKNGKKFDACLILTDDEQGKKTIAFDFEHVEAKKIKDVECPLCKGEIIQTPFGYGCANYDKDNENSCRFSIGKMSEKSLTESQIKELLTKGRTSTIRGFKSKNGKKFDARIALNKDEEGKVTGLKFDFTDLEPLKIKDVECPLCKGEIAQTPFGYGCVNYNKDDENSCRFSIGTIAGVKLKEAQVKQLLQNKKTDVIPGFIAKTGMKFEAPLKLTEDGKIAFDFPEKPKPVPTKLKCPKCENILQKSQWYYECECGFKVGHTVAKVPISEEVMEELLKNGRTKEKVTGFTARSGSLFDAYLTLGENGIAFDFNEVAESTEIKDSSNEEVSQVFMQHSAEEIKN